MDQGYTGESAARAAATAGLKLEVVQLPEAQRGFVLLPKRGVVERSFAWAARFRRLNRTTRHWYSVKLCENTLAVRSERSRASGEVEEQAGRESGGLRLRSATLRPNGKGSTASEEVYESSVV